jgi:hypothetical protein
VKIALTLRNSDESIFLHPGVVHREGTGPSPHVATVDAIASPLEVAVPSSTPGPFGQLPDLPSGSGATLRVDRDAVPRLRKVFDSALSKLDVQIDLAMTAVRVAPWAGDPVSQNAATQFNNHAVDNGDSALNSLLAYQQRLKAASDALTQVAEEYRIVESDNTATFGTQGGC